MCFALPSRSLPLYVSPYGSTGASIPTLSEKTWSAPKTPFYQTYTGYIVIGVCALVAIVLMLFLWDAYQRYRRRRRRDARNHAVQDDVVFYNVAHPGYNAPGVNRDVTVQVYPQPQPVVSRVARSLPSCTLAPAASCPEVLLW